MNTIKKRKIMTFFCVLFLLVYAVVLWVNADAHAKSQALLEESVRMQLISTSIAAREIIDVDAFLTYTDAASWETPEHQATLLKLRDLQEQVGAKYIYALQMLNGQATFVFDTDPEGFFDAYELSPVHEEAFAGKESASIMNVQDKWGSFNTGAVPILQGDQVVGIISTDVEDTFVSQSIAAGRNSLILLSILLGLMLIAILFVLNVVLSKLENIQVDLHHMAHYDKLTNLPNRQFLFEQLGTLTAQKKPEPFAIFFIDLDNFKKVNDNAGHDAGDELLRYIGKYLEQPNESSQVFRPTSGQLSNMTARIGGDEFIIVAPKIDTPEVAADYAKALLDGFRKAEVNQYVKEYNVGLSIGVSLFPTHADDYNVVLKYADTAMYHAKHGGKNNYMVYNDTLTPSEEESNFRTPKSKRV